MLSIYTDLASVAPNVSDNQRSWSAVELASVLIALLGLTTYNVRHNRTI